MKSRNKKILAEIARNFSEGELIVKIEYEGNSQDHQIPRGSSEEVKR